MATLDIQIATGSDDGQETAGTMAITGQTIANDLDNTDEYAAMRYIVPDILSGATITAAYLTVRVTGASNDEPDVTIWCQAADNPGTLTTAASNISGRTATTATVTWASANLGASAGSDHQTPSLVALVQEVVNRGGWAAGNAMVFVMKGNDATGTRDLTFRFFEHADGAAGAPRLHIEYTNPAGGVAPRALHHLRQQGIS